MPARFSPPSAALSATAWCAREWRATKNNRRAKYYCLTEAGRRKLRVETREWESQIAAIARILRTSQGEI